MNLRFSLTAWLHCGNTGQILRHLVGLERFHVHFDQADEWATIIWPLTAASIDDYPDAGDLAAALPHNVDRFLNPPATGDDVFRHNNPLVRPDLETAPEDEAARVFFREDVAFSQGAAHLLANNDSPEGRGDHGVAFKIPELRRELGANLSRHVRVLKEEGALEELAAVQTRPQNKVPIEQCPGFPEERQQILAHHGTPALPRNVQTWREGNIAN
jgi:hypothetical protein